MKDKKKNFKRVTGDGSMIVVMGSPDNETASAFGDLFSMGLDYAFAAARAEITFKRIDPKVQELIERDVPGAFGTKLNVYLAVGDVFRGEFTKLHLSNAKKEIVEKIDKDMQEALEKRPPLTKTQKSFVDAVVTGALAAFPPADKNIPQ